MGEATKIRGPHLRDKHSTQYGMNLPDGKTCGDCVFFKSCAGFVGAIAADETCDWAPSKFRQLPEVAHA